MHGIAFEAYMPTGTNDNEDTATVLSEEDSDDEHVANENEVIVVDTGFCFNRVVFIGGFIFVVVGISALWYYVIVRNSISCAFTRYG